MTTQPPSKPPWWILLLQILPLVFQMVNEVVVQVTEVNTLYPPAMPNKSIDIPDPLDEK